MRSVGRLSRNFEDLEEETQLELRDILDRHYSNESVHLAVQTCTHEAWGRRERLSEDDAELVWEKRDHLRGLPEALPLVLRCAVAWNWTSAPAIRFLLKHWAPLPPYTAVQLLMPQ